MPEYSDQLDVIVDEGGTEAREIQDIINRNEERIMRASYKAMESGSLTPLIKEELRCTIQSRRLAAGKGELHVEEFKKPVKKKTMTEEERKRAQTRRVQNREAAQRFRQRQKDLAGHLTDKIKRLEKSTLSLQNETERLKQERDELRQMLDNHLVFCRNEVTIPEAMCPDLQQLLHRLGDSSTSCDDLSVATPHCPSTGDSNSSVFFHDDASEIHDSGVTYENMLQHMDLSSIDHENGNFVLDLINAPEICQEMVLGDGGDALDSGLEYSDDPRLDSCSSAETAETGSINGSVSSDVYYYTDLSSGLRDAATASMAHISTFDSESFEVSYVTEDIIFMNEDVLS